MDLNSLKEKPTWFKSFLAVQQFDWLYKIIQVSLCMLILQQKTL